MLSSTEDSKDIITEADSVEQQQKQFNIHINVDIHHVAQAPDEDLVNKHRFLLIRHAVTDFNVAFGDCLGKYGELSEEFRSVKIDTKYIDIELKPEGVIQCEKAQEHANKINFRYVFVSQMVRAIQTSVHVFKNHPHKERIRFVVLPLVKEGLNCCNDKCGTLERMRRIVDPLINEHGLNFDFSMMHTFGVPDLVQVNVAVDLERVQQIYSYVEDEGWHPEMGHSHQILKFTYDHFPLKMEGPIDNYQRGVQVRQFIKEYLSLVDEDEKWGDDWKCAIVSHGAFLAALGSSGYDPLRKDCFKPAIMNNCEFMPWQTQYL